MTRQYDNATDLITFSRASNATYMGPSGLIVSAAANEPRVEYDASGNVLGLLVEEARTNLVTYSVPNTANGWGGVGLTVTANQGAAPDGSASAALLTEDSSTTAKYAISPVISFSTGVTYTNSITAYAGTHNLIQMTLPSGQFGSGQYANFNLSTGQITAQSGGVASIYSLGSGVYRCSFSATATSSGSSQSGVIMINTPTDTRVPTYLGSGRTVYVWGQQVEAGAFPTSYIPTSGSTATRAADVASIATSAFGYRDDEGTLFVEFTSGGSDGADYPQAVSLDDPSSGSAIRIGLNLSNTIQGVSTVDGLGNQAVLNGGTYTPRDNLKVSFGFEKDYFALSVNGGSVATDSSGEMPSTIGELGVGRWATSNNINGHIKSIKYYPRRLLNNQLQELTA